MRAIILLSFVLVSGPALAQRVSTTALTCSQAQALVVQRGAIVLSTGPATYERFVADNRFCERDEYAQPETAPTRDAASCVVGLRCRARSELFWSH